MMGVEHIKNIDLLEGAVIAVVYDPVEDLANSAAQLAGGAIVASSLDELIEDQSLDALIIASPNYLHREQIERIIAKRTVPILCEKPLFTDEEDKDRIASIGSSLRSPLWVAMEYRYMPPIAALIEQADTVTGGVKLLSIREHRFPFLEKVGDWNRFNKNTGGTLVEKCCHFFDLMRLILKSEPVRVYATAGQIANHLDERYDGQTPDIWDGGYMVFDFENGSRACLELCMFADGSLWNEEISATGTNGKIECRLPGPHRFWPENIGAPPEPELTISPRTPKNPVTRTIKIDHDLLRAGDHHGSTFYQHQRFLDVVRGIKDPEVTWNDGRIAVLMGMAAQQSAITGQAINF